MTDPFGRALLDHARGERTAPLWQIDGPQEREHPIEEYYFGTRTPETDSTAWLTDWIEGPTLDMGAGVGRDALFFQQRMETVALEVSPHLVTAMAERGVETPREGDMFSLRETFDRDRFRSVFAVGTQLGLAGSTTGLCSFLTDLAYVTTPDATAVVDNYNPVPDGTDQLLGYRHDPTPGVAFRVMHFRYETDRANTLLFRLFSPDRLREATVHTPWTVRDVRVRHETSNHYQAALAKPD